MASYYILLTTICSLVVCDYLPGNGVLLHTTDYYLFTSRVRLPPWEWRFTLHGGCQTVGRLRCGAPPVSYAYPCHVSSLV